MTVPLRERIRNRLEALDQWDDGGGFILASEAGAHIISNTGSQGWNAGAGHEPPPIAPLLRHIYDEVRSNFRSFRDSFSLHLCREIAAAEESFLAGPSFDSLVRYAEIVDSVCPLYQRGQDINDDDALESEFVDNMVDVGLAEDGC